MTTPIRFAFRAQPTDIHAIETIAGALRSTGMPFATRTDAVRFCLEAVAADPRRFAGAREK